MFEKTHCNEHNEGSTKVERGERRLIHDLICDLISDLFGLIVDVVVALC